MNRFILSTAGAALALLIMPASALAHAKLVSSTPAANATIAKATSINLQFNEKIIASTMKTELVMTAMPGMADHPPMKIAFTSAMGKDGKSMTLILKRALVPGTYKVKWSAAGADTHRMGSEFSFTVK
jgi:copper resistance protein C